MKTLQTSNFSTPLGNEPKHQLPQGIKSVSLGQMTLLAPDNVHVKASQPDLVSSETVNMVSLLSQFLPLSTLPNPDIPIFSGDPFIALSGIRHLKPLQSRELLLMEIEYII